MAAEKTVESIANRLLNLDAAMRVSEQETFEFIESKKNTATKKKTKSDVGRFQEWLSGENETRSLEDISPTELDMYISRFILSVRNTKTNKELEPTTLKGFMSSIRRYLNDREYPADLSTDRLFRHSRETLKAKSVDLKEKGMGNKENRSDPFTKSEVEIMYQRNILGSESAEALISTLWLNNTMHFGLRGRQEHTSMLWGDVEVKNTADGTRYLQFTERATKTRKNIADDPRMFQPKIFEVEGDPNCPVKLYLLYKAKRPDEDPNGKFYLGINRYNKTNDGPWYIKAAMGKNTLGSIAKKISEKAGFSARHTNHSGRKTVISNLLEAGCPPTEVAQLSGHKNIQSLNHYHTISIDKQKQMSSIIHKTATATSTVTTSTIENSQMNDGLDDELMISSQEIETTLQTIQSYEQVHDPQIIDLPVRQSPGGSMNLNPLAHLFSGCTFNSPVTINMK